jgi:hypothetical protein
MTGDATYDRCLAGRHYERRGHEDLGRFLTLYKEQWTKLLDMADDIRAFLKENDSRLKSKS